MKTIKTVMAITLLMVLVGACSTPKTPNACSTVKTPKTQDQSHGGADINTLDDQFRKVAELVPGFGGMFLDENGILNVYMVELRQSLSVEALDTQKAQLENAFKVVFGKDFLLEGRDQRLFSNQLSPQQALVIKIVKGRYDIQQLSKWRISVDQMLDMPGVVLTDLDERQNRLKVGVTSAALLEQIKARLIMLGVPTDAVIFEETKPIKFYQTLRDYQRPMIGGIQIACCKVAFWDQFCTMGFNVRRGNTYGFMTNSHCTSNQGGVEPTVFSQPSALLFSIANKVGVEVSDPEYFTGGICPDGRRCRFSDSAFVEYEGIPFESFIARTTDQGDGSIAITNPVFQIVREETATFMGTRLNKVGRTTGWTTGIVTKTCTSFGVEGTDIVLLCQYAVEADHSTTKIVDKGDSGSPVFEWLGNNQVSLHGLLWGGSESEFVFSPISGIKRELGEFTTFDFPPSPKPPPSCCPSGKHCCGSCESGTCDDACIGKGQSCP